MLCKLKSELRKHSGGIRRSVDKSNTGLARQPSQVLIGNFQTSLASTDGGAISAHDTTFGVYRICIYIFPAPFYRKDHPPIQMHAPLSLREVTGSKPQKSKGGKRT